MVDANFANDPEAAHIVLRSGADITLVGMDVTMTTLLTTGMIDEVALEGDEAAKTLMRMTEFYVEAYKRMYPGIAAAVCTTRSRSRSRRIRAWPEWSACSSTWRYTESSPEDRRSPIGDLLPFPCTMWTCAWT